MKGLSFSWQYFHFQVKRVYFREIGFFSIVPLGFVVSRLGLLKKKDIVKIGNIDILCTLNSSNGQTFCAQTFNLKFAIVKNTFMQKYSILEIL